MNKLLGYIFYFSLASVIVFFLGIFIFQVGDELILTPIHNVTNSSGAVLGISSAIQTSMDADLTSYRNLNIPYDLFFLFSFISMFAFTIISSYKSREQSYISFFGMITLGLMGFLLLTSFIVVIKDWLILNLITSVLAFDLNTTPIFNYYVNNMGFLNFLWAVILIIINKLPFTLNRDNEENDINDFTKDGGFQQ